MKTLLVFVVTAILLNNCNFSESLSSFAQEAENLVDRVAKLEGQALQVYIKSEGCNDVDITGCGHATIMVNGKDYAKKGRGHNIVVVNAQTGIVESSSTFDTYASWTVANKMANFLNTLQKRKLVLIAIQDESSLHMNGNAYNALVKLGAYYPLKKKYRSSYAQIGWTGPGQIDVIAQVQKLQYKGPSIIAKVIPLPL